MSFFSMCLECFADWVSGLHCSLCLDQCLLWQTFEQYVPFLQDEHTLSFWHAEVTPQRRQFCWDSLLYLVTPSPVGVTLARLNGSLALSPWLCNQRGSAPHCHIYNNGYNIQHYFGDSRHIFSDVYAVRDNSGAVTLSAG